MKFIRSYIYKVSIPKNRLYSIDIYLFFFLGWNWNERRMLKDIHSRFFWSFDSFLYPSKGLLFICCNLVEFVCIDISPIPFGMSDESVKMVEIDFKIKYISFLLWTICVIGCVFRILKFYLCSSWWNFERFQFAMLCLYFPVSDSLVS